MIQHHPSRVLSVQSPAIPLVAGQPALEPTKLEGTEGINTLFEYRLTLQTPDAGNFQPGAGSNFDLEGFVGLELTCCIAIDGHGTFSPGAAGGAGANQGRGVREISGLITEARFLGEDSRHAVYELTLRPWLHLACLTTDCKVFQDSTPVDIIDAVLADYPFASDKRLIETYPPRDYTVQYNESDFEFLTRQMQEWGINYHFEHSAGVHRLVWSDHNGAFDVTQKDATAGSASGPSGYHTISFFPPGHKIDREYIHALSPVDSLTSGSYVSRDHDYTRPRAELTAQASAPRQTGHAGQEVYLWRGDRAGLGGSDYSQPNKGADKAANQTESQGLHLARLRMQTLRQPGSRASGAGHVRGIVPGCTFHLSGHPQDQANTEYITLHTRFLIENVGQDTQRDTPQGTPYDLQAETGPEGGGGNPAAARPGPRRLTGRWQVLVQFDVQPSTEALRPQASQRKPRTGGPQSALVVGPGTDTAQSDIYTDALGRIKVQFPWDRSGQNNQNSSCWVRVASLWAGNQLGAMHLPRIGQEVMVDFIEGDPDRPIVCGRVYNQLNTPPWSLPAQQALSGFRSRELTPGAGNSAAGRSNHLILDDTKQKIQAQLKSDHQHSQLCLGHITRIDNNAGRQDARGEGFELRTDGHGVVRARHGLLVTTEARPNARAHAKDMAETSQRLAQAHGQHAGLGQLALQHRAHDEQDQAAVADRLKAQHEALSGTAANTATRPDARFPEFSEPHLALASPAGIESTTSGATHQHSGEHHAVTAGGHASISAARSWLASARQAIRLFACQAGMRLVAAQADIDIQALQKCVNVLAGLDITHTASRIALTARNEVLINGGGSYTRWRAGSVESGTTGTHTVHAASHAMAAPANAPVPLHVPPVAPLPQSLWLDLKAQAASTEGFALAGEPYQLLRDGRVIDQGLTDSWGRILVKDHEDDTVHYQVRLADKHLTDIDVHAEISGADIDKNRGLRGPAA